MSDQKPLGGTRWAFAAGNMPDGSTGHEPEFTSRDELCFLNTTGQDAVAEVSVYHVDHEPVGPYRIDVAARRVLHVRVNDLMDPQAVPLGEPYGVTVTSEIPLVIQMRHVDTRQAELAVAVNTGFTGDC